MKGRRKLVVWAVCGGGLVVVLAAVALTWTEVRFAWSFRRLAHRPGGYVAAAVRGELSDEERDLETWFVDHAELCLPLLRRRLYSSDRRTKLAALELIGRIESERGERVDLEDFWSAFEERGAVEEMLAGSFEVLIAGGATGFHHHEVSPIVLVRSTPETTSIWVMEGPLGVSDPLWVLSWDETSGQRARPVHKYVMRTDAAPLRRSLARALTLEERFDELRGDYGPNSYCLLAGGAGRRTSLEFTGWTWLDQLTDHYRALATPPFSGTPEGFDDGDALDALVTVFERGAPEPFLVQAVFGLLDLEAGARDLETARRRLCALPPSRPHAVARHAVGDSSLLVELLPQWGAIGRMDLESLVAQLPRSLLGVILEDLVGRSSGGPLRAGDEWLWSALGGQFNALTHDELATLVAALGSLSPAALNAFLQGLSRNSACLGRRALGLLRDLPEAAQATFFGELGIEPSETGDGRWAKLIEGLAKLPAEEIERILQEVRR